MGMRMFLVMLLRMPLVRVAVAVVGVVCQMHVELHPFDAALVFAGGVQVVFLQAQFLQLVLQLMEIHAEVQQGADEHVAAEAAKNIKIKSFHETAAKALIWLAA